MLEERSAGAVVFRREEGGLIKYLLLHYTAGHHDFPKGNIEEGEREEETALREVEEEAGISDARFLPGFREEIRYYYRRGGSLVRKEVVFFLAETSTEAVKISFEHLGYAWLGLEDALQRLTFDSARKILREAHIFLGGLMVREAKSLDSYFN